MEIKSGDKKEKNDEAGEGAAVACKKDPLDNRMRISTITALARAIHQQSVARRKFQQNNNGI